MEWELEVLEELEELVDGFGWIGKIGNWMDVYIEYILSLELLAFDLLLNIIG